MSYSDIARYEIVKKIGEGASSKAYIIIDLNTKKKYVAKISNYSIDDIDNEEYKSFKKRIDKIKSLEHPSILKIVDYYPEDFNGEPYPTIITELAVNKSLHSMIDHEKCCLCPLEWNFTKKFINIYGIASGMSYIHSKGIIHGNLKPENILLDEKFYPKICDFKPLIKNTLSESKTLQFYLAPEILFGTSECSNSIDVYAFAFIVYDLLNSTTSSKFFNDNQKSIDYLIRGYRPKFDKFIPEAYKNLIERCWSENPANRPTFEQIVKELEVNKDFLSWPNVEIDEVEFYDYCLIEREMIDSSVNQMNSKKDDDNCFLIYDGCRYQKGSLKCCYCQKTIENFENYVCLERGLFICKSEFDEYCEMLVQQSINEIINPIILNNDDQNINDELIEPEMIENSYILNKNCKYFIPTVTFHFEFSLEKINFEKLLEIIPEEMIIVNIEPGSTFLTIAFILSDEYQDIKEKYQEIIEVFKAKINDFTALNEPIVGNLKGEPILKIPDENDIKEFYSKKSVNIFQNEKIFERNDFRKIKKEIKKSLKFQKEKFKNKDWAFIINHFNLFATCENQIYQHIKDNEIEFIIVGETLIPNRFYKKYKKIKNHILENDESINESFIYHGTSIFNQKGIIGKHFYNPDENQLKKRDDGYFGIGIYATDNIFYSSLYSNDYYLLNYNEKATILCCKAIFNENFKIEINENNVYEFEGQLISEEIKRNYGVHTAFVESNKDFRMSFKKEIKESLIKANEYVFANKYQLIPICSLTIMRTEFFILWIDETKKYSNFCDELKTIIEENVYYSNSDEESREIVEKKKRNKMKIILSFNSFEWGKIIIKSIRNIIGSKFVFFVFSDELNQKDIANEIENVIYSNDFEELKKFAKIDLKLESMISFCNEIKNKYDIEMNINEESLLQFNIDKFKIPLKLFK